MTLSARARKLLAPVLARPMVELAVHLPSLTSLRLLRRLLGIQFHPDELQLILRAVRSRCPCRFLVLGVGNDSLLWQRANAQGETRFLEDDESWMASVSRRYKKLQVDMIDYGTKRSQWRDLLECPARLEIDLPAEIRRGVWDVVLVDAPAGWCETSPGRMRSIYLAACVTRGGSDVFVHDCDRDVEREYCDRYLKSENLIQEVRRLRHYHLDEAGT